MSLGIRQQLGKSKTRGKQLLHRSDNLTPKWNDDTKSYLLSFLPQLEKELDRLKNLFLEWENHVNEMDDDADRDTEQQLFDSWKEDEEYVNLISDLECTINFGQSIKEPTKPIDTKIPAKIAVQDIKKFDGDYMKWNPFWQRFVLNIDSKSYAPIDKLDTLLGLLDGKAYDEVQGFAVIGENYDAVKQTLIDRYGNNKRVIYELQNKLHMIPPAKATATSLRETITSITNVCRQMENLGIDLNNATTKWEIIRKMPTEERNELSIAYQTEQETTTNDILKKMKQYKLKAEIRAQTEKESYSYPDSPPSFKFARSPSKKWVCSFCNDNHPSGACDKFKSIAERINQLRSQQRCFKCAGRYHSSKECRANVTCQHCNGHHRSFLCDKSKSSNFTKPTAATKTNVFLAAERIQLLQQNQSPLLAKEITVKNAENDKEARAVVFLDSGAQRNYVSNDLVRKLYHVL
uniref:Peptidase aspartic putative domain-containing protein n=1 Tax=Panagrolaimus davidi TaxID=227884 RepID=A0A914Q872_9BILA